MIQHIVWEVGPLSYRELSEYLDALVIDEGYTIISASIVGDVRLREDIKEYHWVLVTSNNRG